VGVASLDDLLTPSMEVYQAQGMVMVDLGVSLADALVRLRAYAFVEGRPVAEVARDVVAGRVRLDP
jgi:AmiR/NasT family two-component response regulator